MKQEACPNIIPAQRGLGRYAPTSWERLHRSRGARTGCLAMVRAARWCHCVTDLQRPREEPHGRMASLYGPADDWKRLPRAYAEVLERFAHGCTECVGAQGSVCGRLCPSSICVGVGKASDSLSSMGPSWLMTPS